MVQAKRDNNHVTTLLGVSEVDLETPTLLAVDPVTNRLLVDSTGGGGGGGDASAANQVIGNASLASIDAKIDALTTPTDTQPVTMTGVISAGNSTTTPLLAGATFTGTTEDALEYNEIRVTLGSTHASAVNGFSIQQSTDGTNWDIADAYTIPANVGKTFSAPRQARFVRVVYINGGTTQTLFRLATILNRTGTKASSQRPSDAYSNEVDLDQNWAFLQTFNGTTWDRARGDITNGLDVDVTRSALPTGAATSALQTQPGVDIGDVTINNAAGAAAVNIQDGGNSITVDGTVTLGAGAAVIGAITNLIPGSGTTNLGAAVDSVRVATKVGVLAIGVRDDVLSTLTPADNDYIEGMRVDSTGAQWVRVTSIDSALPAGTNAIGKFTQPDTPTLANVTMTGASVTVQASNTARRNWMIFNDSGVVVYLKLGSTASSTSFTVKLQNQAYYELPDPVYTGIITALGASGSVRVTEVV